MTGTMLQQAESRGEARRPGTDVGVATYVPDVADRATPHGGHPGAATVFDDDAVKVVAFEFEAGDELREHAVHHPIVVQVLRGWVEFVVPDRVVRLGPGQLLHLTPQLRHAVRAMERTTLTVTMLRSATPHD